MSAYLECGRCDGRGYLANNAVGMVDTTDCPECGGNGESHDVACPGCSLRTPDVLLCRHDDAPAGPMCPGCCTKEHPNPCPDCFGHGSFVVQSAGEFGIHNATCATCEGTGRANEGGKP